jgi:hypothetical protein
MDEVGLNDELIRAKILSFPSSEKDIGRKASEYSTTTLLNPRIHLNMALTID